MFCQLARLHLSARRFFSTADEFSHANINISALEFMNAILFSRAENADRKSGFLGDLHAGENGC